MNTNIDNYNFLKYARKVLSKQFEHKNTFILRSVHRMKMKMEFKNCISLLFNKFKRNKSRLHLLSFVL